MPMRGTSLSYSSPHQRSTRKWGIIASQHQLLASTLCMGIWQSAKGKEVTAILQSIRKKQRKSGPMWHLNMMIIRATCFRSSSSRRSPIYLARSQKVVLNPATYSAVGVSANNAIHLSRRQFAPSKSPEHSAAR
jgi:hypothetical protein